MPTIGNQRAHFAYHGAEVTLAAANTLNDGVCRYGAETNAVVLGDDSLRWGQRIHDVCDRLLGERCDRWSIRRGHRK